MNVVMLVPIKYEHLIYTYWLMSIGVIKNCFINYIRVRILLAALEPHGYSIRCDMNQYLRKEYADNSLFKI